VVTEVPPADDSQLELAELRLADGDVHRVADPDHDTVFFVVEGRVTLDDTEVPSAAIVRAGEDADLLAAADARILELKIGTAAEEHAPLGADARVVAVDRAEDDSATGKRAFQVLFGPENGCCHATLFVGYVPPGKAPWHFHLYDEIVWIWQGKARYHFGDTVQELEPGSAVRIRPRDVHIVENLSETDELVLLGLFTPAGSPSAAYLARGPAERHLDGRAAERAPTVP
jgi:quercetin dioxygenase-like cupin family protein